LIFFGKKPETELADAKYDGKINPLDIIQIKLIIVGKEKELTIVDGAERIVTVKQPVKRTIPLITGFTGFLYELGAGDTIVGVPQSGRFPTQYYYPQVKDLSDLGWLGDLDYELVVELQPDVVFTLTGWLGKAEPLVKLGIPVIGLSTSGLGLRSLNNNVRLIGAIVDKHEEAEALAAEMEATFSMISERTKDIPEGDRPLVYATYLGRAYGEKSWCTESINLAGGINIYGHLPGGIPDLEYVVEKNPDVIFIMVVAKDRQDFIEMAKNHINDTRNLPGFSHIDAVRNNRFCVIDNHYANFGPDHPENVVAIAKMLHPDLFTDLQFGEWVYVAGGEE
ncbi:MAG: ABC transporter substrate-binding protein, partial [Methanophagales archaeon]|nr:ABC transporter substrate-binding protein [Methanophagales archaeon]